LATYREIEVASLGIRLGKGISLKVENPGGERREELGNAWE